MIGVFNCSQHCHLLVVYWDTQRDKDSVSLQSVAPSQVGLDMKISPKYSRGRIIDWGLVEKIVKVLGAKLALFLSRMRNGSSMSQKQARKPQSYASLAFWPQGRNGGSACHGKTNLLHQNMKDSSCWIIDRGLNEKISKLLKGDKLVANEKSLLILSTSLGRLKQGDFSWCRGFTAEKSVTCV